MCTGSYVFIRRSEGCRFDSRMGLRNIFLSLRLKLSSKQFTFFVMFSNFAAFLFWSRLFSILKRSKSKNSIFFLTSCFYFIMFLLGVQATNHSLHRSKTLEYAANWYAVVRVPVRPGFYTPSRSWWVCFYEGRYAPS